MSTSPKTSTFFLARFRSDGGYDRFEKWSEIPMLFLSAVFLAVLVIPVIDPHLSSGTKTTFNVADLSIWVIFALEYLIRFYLSPSRPSFVRHHVLDLLVVAVPVLRPVRIVRIVRFVRVGSLSGTASQRTKSRLHIDVAIQVVIVALILVFIAAVGILDVERNAPGSNIHNFGQALWWALVTVTTVGYGDRYPVTGEGQLIAAAVMITGIAVLGVVTAAIAAWFVSHLREIESEETTEMKRAERLEAALTEALTRLGRLEAYFGTHLDTLPATDGDG